ncbi:SGNH/GDSL hydrolase family protein [Nonomuraea glycinis]|uniref:SGNH/GDSL hydrolase family protein n=1 Tax=Nonomuraea glycinis TaxID=2047744 RepID=UPI0033B43682
MLVLIARIPNRPHVRTFTWSSAIPDRMLSPSDLDGSHQKGELSMTTRSRIIAGVMCFIVGGGLMWAATPAGAQITPRLNVVALGDSTAAGTGAGNYQPGTEQTCYRSHNSASTILVKRLKQRGAKVNFVNVTCSGAAIADLRKTFKGEPPQLNALRRDTGLVTLTVGGNDIDLAAFGNVCLQGDCTGAATTAILERVPGVAPTLRGLLAKIKQRSPRAQIILTGYGRAVTDGPNTPDVALDPICDAGVLTEEERASGGRVFAALDAALSRAARSAKASGINVRFVSPYRNSTALRPEFAGHSLCESTTPFYRGFDALAPGQEGPVAVLHLNQQGHAALAQLILRQTLPTGIRALKS